MIGLLPLLLMGAEPAIDCENAMTQMDMNYCSFEDYKAADAQLNEAWVVASARAKGNDSWARDNGREAGYFAKLLEAQRAWINFRDSHCEAEADRYRGGSIWPLIYSSCKTKLTFERTQQLTEYVETEN